MTKETKLQIPITNKFKTALSKKADEFGLSSANEVARFVLHHFINGNYSVALVDSHLAAIPMLDEETEKRVHESMEAYKRGEYDILDYNKDKNALRKVLNEMGHTSD